MSVEVNYLAVVLAMVSSMVIGSVWYLKNVFGLKWVQWAGLSSKHLDEANPKAIAVTAVVSLITAYVLAHVAFLSNYYFGNSFLQDSLSTAFWLWLGLTAARMVTHDMFEGRPAKLTVLNAAHELITLLTMGLIIGLIKP